MGIFRKERLGIIFFWTAEFNKNSILPPSCYKDLEYEKEYKYMDIWITESFCYAAEINIINQLYVNAFFVNKILKNVFRSLFSRSHLNIRNVYFLEFPLWHSGIQCCLCSARWQVWSPALNTGLRIWCYCSCGVSGNSGSDLTSGLGAPYAMVWPKNKERKVYFQKWIWIFCFRLHGNITSLVIILLFILFYFIFFAYTLGMQKFWARDWTHTPAVTTPDP